MGEASERKPPAVRVFLETYGCTLNQAESDIMAGILKSGGHTLCEKEEDAEILIINTCTVKGATENKIIARIKKLVAEGKPIVLAGCLSADEKRLRSFAPTAPIVKTMSISRIADAIEDAIDGQATVFSDYERKDRLPRIFTAPILRVPINDGCVGHCNYCQTKIARPYLRSYSMKTVSGWISEGISNGAKEIQLASQDLGAYGLDIRSDLIKLLDTIQGDDSEMRLRAVSASGSGDFFIRLGMINPDHAKRMLPDIARHLKSPNMYRFIHIPLQSGSEKVCKDMERSHSVADFVAIVKRLRDETPDLTIATDIIVGYPTEREEDYQMTLDLMRSLKLDVVNVSKFSPRPGTKAKSMEQLDNGTIKRRSSELVPIVREVSAEKNRELIGRTFKALVTEKDRDFKGRTMSYKTVVIRDFDGRLGDIVDVRIIGAAYWGLFGEII